MKWQELPEIKSDIIKLGAEVDIHYQNWSKPITIPNNADQDTILSITATESKEI